MRLRPYLSPALTLAVLAGVASAAYLTRESWLPHVIPQKPEAKVDEAAPKEPGEATRVKISPQAQKNLGLDVDTPTPQEYWRTILIQGTVVDRPGESDRIVTSKVAGVITEIRAKPGDTLKPGEPLFTLQLASEVLQTLQNDLNKVVREVGFSTAKRDRYARLVRESAQSETLLIEEENQLKRLSTQAQSLRRQLQIFGLNAEQIASAEKGEFITEIVVSAPAVSGSLAEAPPGEALFEMQELKVALGEQVSAGQTICLLANHQRLFVEGAAFQSEAEAVATAARQKVPIKVEFADETNGTWKAQAPLAIHHLANQHENGSRTLPFFLALDNEFTTFERDGQRRVLWRYRPGQRVRLRLPVEKLGVEGKSASLPFIFPAGAVVREGPETYMFVQTGDVFVRKTVRVLFEDRSEIVIANDGSITEADFVCRNQAAALNRTLKAAGAEEHAGHDHSH